MNGKEALNELVSTCCCNCDLVGKECLTCIIKQRKSIILEDLNYEKGKN